MTDEAGYIDRLRAIATHPAARGLADDTALLDGLVLTHDMIAQGVHFLPTDPPASVGWKLVAVNLSDLAAKGATPLAALMGASLSGDEAWDAALLSGVAGACETYGLALVGGDTIALPEGAPLVFGLTAIGRAGTRVPARSGGRAGDGLWLIGTLGEAAAGLAQLTDDPKAVGELVDAYRRPIPLIAAGCALAGIATATMDVSDGLLLDAARMADASGCAVRIDLAALPLGEAFIAARGEGRAARLFAATGGDDYALLAAIPAEAEGGLRESLPSGSKITRVGSLVAGKGIALVDGNEAVPVPERLGYAHHRPQPSPDVDRADRPRLGHGRRLAGALKTGALKPRSKR